MSNLFDETNIEQPVDETKNYLEELVGEGKKFKDVESLAKGKATSDAFIENLQQELAAARQELKTQATMDDILKRLGQAKPENTTVETNQREPDGNVNQPEEISKLVQKILDDTTTKQRQEANYQLVVSELEKTYGKAYPQYLNAKLAELGMGKDFATDLARTQPKAFLTLFGSSGPVSDPASGIPRGVNTSSFTNSNGTVRGDKYYSKLRDQMGAIKFNADEKIQQQRWKDIQTLGYEKFNAN